MFVSCVHPLAVRNAALCMTCSLLMLVEDAKATIWKKHTPDPVSLLPYRSHDCSPHPVTASASIICRCLSDCTEIL